MQPITVRTVENTADCQRVVSLTAHAFPEEVRGAGLTPAQYLDIESEELSQQPWIWPYIGLAFQGETFLGVVVVKVAGLKEKHLSYWEVNKRVGISPTFWNFWYDHLLADPLKEDDVLVEYIAVTEEARGKGVGRLLMAWGEQAGVRLMTEQRQKLPSLNMVLWVAADNAIAMSLYQKCGYLAVEKTSDDPWSIWYHLFKSFLGHPVWVKMKKSLSLTVPASPDVSSGKKMERISSRVFPDSVVSSLEPIWDGLEPGQVSFSRTVSIKEATALVMTKT